jgi:hypothetical protein
LKRINKNFLLLKSNGIDSVLNYVPLEKRDFVPDLEYEEIIQDKAQKKKIDGNNFINFPKEKKNDFPLNMNIVKTVVNPLTDNQETNRRVRKFQIY